MNSKSRGWTDGGASSLRMSSKSRSFSSLLSAIFGFVFIVRQISRAMIQGYHTFVKMSRGRIKTSSAFLYPEVKNLLTHSFAESPSITPKCAHILISQPALAEEITLKPIRPASALGDGDTGLWRRGVRTWKIAELFLEGRSMEGSLETTEGVFYILYMTFLFRKTNNDILK